MIKNDGIFNAEGSLCSKRGQPQYQIECQIRSDCWGSCSVELWVSPGTEIPFSLGSCPNDWPILAVKNFFLIPPCNLQKLLFVSIAPYPFIVCLWGKRLFPSSWYPPITQLKTAINYTHTHSSSLPFFKLNKPICEPLLVPCVHQPSDHLDALLLGFVQYVNVCLVLGSLKLDVVQDGLTSASY